MYVDVCRLYSTVHFCQPGNMRSRQRGRSRVNFLTGASWACLSFLFLSFSLSPCSSLQLCRASLTCQRRIHAKRHGPANGSSALRSIALICLSSNNRGDRVLKETPNCWGRDVRDDDDANNDRIVFLSVFSFECECKVTMFAQCHRLSVKRG